MRTYVKARGVRKVYDKTVALDDVSLEINEGEIFALLGPNGAGKTTFIKILSTLLLKDAGNVEIFGYDLDKQEKEIQHVFGYVGQDTERSAYSRLTVLENLHFFGSLRGLSRKRIKDQVEKLATSLNFESNLDKMFMHLSGGQKQAVVIMRALIHNPPVVYLDEPTKGLDPIVASKMRTFLKDYAHRERKALLLTSHILSEVEQLADRVGLIDSGKISVVGTTESLKADVGANEFVEVQSDGLPDTTMEKILALDPVLFTRKREPEWISFGVDDLFDGTQAVIKVLRDDNIHTMIRQQPVSLEDAFLHYVGREDAEFVKV